MIRFEALSPGELRAQDKDVQIRYGCADSAFGRFIVGNTARGFCHLAFHADGSNEEMAALALRRE